MIRRIFEIKQKEGKKMVLSDDAEPELFVV